MSNPTAAEARLRKSLELLREEIAIAIAPAKKDSFEETIRGALARLKSLLGLG